MNTGWADQSKQTKGSHVTVFKAMGAPAKSETLENGSRGGDGLLLGLWAWMAHTRPVLLTSRRDPKRGLVKGGLAMWVFPPADHVL